LCAIAFAAIIAQLRKADLKWDKTIKSGKAKIQTWRRQRALSPGWRLRTDGKRIGCSGARSALAPS